MRHKAASLLMGIAAMIACWGAAPAHAQQLGAPALLSDSVPSSDTGHDFEPRLATDGSGNWVAVWRSNDTLGGTLGTDSDILVARSADDGATWTAPAALNTNAATDSGEDGNPRVTTDGAGNWVSVWNSTDSLGGTIGTDGDILVARSTDNGATWTAPAALNHAATADSGIDAMPQIATDGAGNWVTVWYTNDYLGGLLGSDNDILVSRSTNNGATWSTALPLNTNAGTDSGSDIRPQLSTDGAGNWVTVWQSDDSLGGTIGTEGDILVASSTDNGATWTAPAALNGNAAADSGYDNLPALETDGAGNWMAVWNSDDSLGGTIGTDFDILLARSTDGGATWTAPAALNTNADVDSGYDEAARIASDGAGNWVAVWDSDDSLGDTIESDHDILVARSADDGATWTAPAALNSNAVTDTGFDVLPEMVTDRAGNWVTVWISQDPLIGTFGNDYDIFFARSLDDGATWTALDALNSNATADRGADTQPQVTTDGAGNWVAVWASLDSLGGTTGTDSDILVARSTDNGATWTMPDSLNGNAASDAGSDTQPQVTTDGAGNWVAVWTSTDSLGGTIDTDRDILFARSPNDGATWTAPAPLNANAATDSGNDIDPQLTTDGDGNWVAVWTSDDDLGGTIDSDNDILVARSTDNGATWTAPAALNSNAAADSGSDSQPQVATDGTGDWVAVWRSTDSLDGTIGSDEDILVARSTDNGVTWTAPAALSATAATDFVSDVEPQVTTDGAGNWVAVWTSNDSLGGTIGFDQDILVARSANSGATWTAPAALNTTATSDSRNDLTPQITTDGLGNWAAVWRFQMMASEQDALIASSTDNGATWTAPADLNTNAASDAGNDQLPQITTDGAGHWVAVWQSTDALGGDASFGVNDIFVAIGGLCGDSVPVGDEQCDDGGAVSGDCCSSSCEVEIVDAASCFVAPNTKLEIKAPADATKRKLTWQWSKGEAVVQADVGTPHIDTNYHLCIYDTSASQPSLAFALDVPASSTLWTNSDPKGVKYEDRSAAADGVKALQVKTGIDTEAKAKLSAKGATVPLPPAAGPTYFEQDPRVVAQLVNDDGSCWTSEFTLSDTKSHDGTQFKSKTR